MEFSVKSSDLLAKLELAANAVERKSTIPILSNVLLCAKDGRVHITATDLELSLNTSCEAKVKREGAATVPAKKLLDLVRLLPETEIRFKALENHWVQIACDRKTYKLVGMSAENFPKLPEMPEKARNISAETFCKLKSRVTFAISEEASRYTMSGALMTFNHALSMVATDGHRLAHASSLDADCDGAEQAAIVPSKALTLIAQASKKLAVKSSLLYAQIDTHLFFKAEEWLIIARQLTGKFPNYEAVMPKEPKVVASVDREEMKAALSRVAQMADARSHAVKITITKEGIELAAASPECGEAKEALTADGATGEMVIGFNAKYLLDFLSATDSERVTISLKDEQSAGDFRPAGESDYRYVVMPMRI